MVDAEFQEIAVRVKMLKSMPDEEEVLFLYGLYKQATLGDCNKECPSMFDPLDKAKWFYWEEMRGTSQEDAKKQYIEHAQSLIESYGLREDAK